MGAYVSLIVSQVHWLIWKIIPLIYGCKHTPTFSQYKATTLGSFHLQICLLLIRWQIKIINIYPPTEDTWGADSSSSGRTASGVRNEARGVKKPECYSYLTVHCCSITNETKNTYGPKHKGINAGRNSNSSQKETIAEENQQQTPPRKKHPLQNQRSSQSIRCSFHLLLAWLPYNHRMVSSGSRKPPVFVLWSPLKLSHQSFVSSLANTLKLYFPLN